MSVGEWALVLDGVKNTLRQIFDAVLERLAAVQIPVDADYVHQEKFVAVLTEYQVVLLFYLFFEWRYDSIQKNQDSTNRRAASKC